MQNYDAALAAMLTDTTQTSDFAYDEPVQDAYGMLDGRVGAVQFQGGVRAEHAGTTFDLRTRDQRFSNPYSSLFPSGLVSFALDDADRFKVSYSTRIRRPDDPDLLDPTPHALDALNISVGNPHLRPEYIRAFEVGYQRTGDRITRAGHAVLPAFVRCGDQHSHGRHGRRHHAHPQPTSPRRTPTVPTPPWRWASGGRLSGFIGGSAYHQKSNAGNLDPLPLGEHVWLERAHEHRVSHVANHRCASARDVRRADDGRGKAGTLLARA